MKNLSDEELLTELICAYGDHDAVSEEYAELLSRLARGRKAIEAIEKVKQAYNKESNDMQFDDDIFKICCDYQQSCKETADGRL